MKYILLHCDGVADEPLDEYGGRTPLELARKPNMDLIASYGEIGIYSPIPEGMPAGSDVGTMTLFGYDPKRYYTGRAPIEALSMGIDMDDEDVAFRCNLVTLIERNGKLIMEDYSAGHIQTDEGRILLNEIKKALDDSLRTFYPGVAYRHIMIWKNGPLNLSIPPPHDIMGEEIEKYLAPHPEIKELVFRSMEILKSHPLNERRKEEGKKPATSIWLWGEGKKVSLPDFKTIYGLNGAVISAVNLVKGIGRAAGMKIIEVPGATGYMDTNFKGKVEYAIDALKKDVDIVILHVEGIDEVSHEGDVEGKIRAIETYDIEVVGRVLREIEVFESYAIMLTTDHKTPVKVRTHTHGYVPFAIYTSLDASKKEGLPRRFTEKDAGTGVRVEPPYELMRRFIKSGR